MGGSSKKKLKELEERNGKLEEKFRRTQQALLAAQEKANKAEEDRDSAARKLAEVTNTQSAHAGQRRTHAQHTEDSGAADSEAPPAKRATLEDGRPAPSEALRAEVRELGVKFALEYGLWFDDPEVLGTKKHPFLRTYDPALRFENCGSAEKNLAMRAQGQFNDGMRQQVSNMASRVRSHPCEILGPEIATLLNDTNTEINTKFKHFAVRIGYQPATATTPPRYSALSCPIIRYPENDKTINSLFRARGPQWIAISHLRGVMSAQKSRQSNGTTIHTPSQRHIQRMYKIKRTRAALIAGSCTFYHNGTDRHQYRFVLSGDEEFAERGDKTTIEYQKDFNTYLSVLFDGLRTQSQPILDVFADWDRVVFGRTDTQHGIEVRTSEQADRDELAALRAEMAAAAPAADEPAPDEHLLRADEHDGRPLQEPQQGPDVFGELSQEAMDEINGDPSAAEDDDELVIVHKKSNGRPSKQPVIADSGAESEDD
ncbi:hypothetical protein AURDEDRAFT_123630 [Auricularia subglabra TFB-10046 SS5]|nr:hypothetical protein AURDEDRAFT_123630 [Auricularia subglabra TFB-10046 SS5]